MSGVVLDVPGVTPRPSFFSALFVVLAGYVCAGLTLVGLALGVQALGLLPPSFAPAGPFPADGPWSLAADLAAATVVVLVAAWWVRWAVAGSVRAPVSFGVVAIAVALTAYAPVLEFRALPLLMLPATTWFVRRYAIGPALPFSRVPWRAWAALGVVAFGIFASYGVYHPLTEDGFDANLNVRASGTLSMVVTLNNPGLADVTILRVDGGFLVGRWRRFTLPYTLKARSQTGLSVFTKGCATPAVNVTYSVFGVTSSKRFTVGSLASCQR